MIKLEKKESIYFLIMDAGENRWNTTFVREIAKALDTIEDDEGPGESAEHTWCHVRSGERDDTI